jgi:RND family efflux transporter MFP subunit
MKRFGIDSIVAFPNFNGSSTKPTSVFFPFISLFSSNMNTLQTMGLILAPLFIISNGCRPHTTPSESEQSPYIVYHPEVVDTLFDFNYVADIQAIRHVEIRPRVTGFVQKFLVDEGAKVNKDQLLARLNNQEYEQQILRSAAALKSAEAELKAKEFALEKTRELYDKNIVSFAEVTVAEAAMDAALAAVALARSEQKTAQLNSEYTQIKAPFDGYINNIHFRSGSLVDEEDVLTTISRTDTVYVYFNVSEREYLQLHADREIYRLSVRLTLADGSVYQHTGRVEIVEGIIDRVSGSISFRAKFPNPEFKLKHGGSGQITLPRSISNTILIASKSAFEVQDKTLVYVVEKTGIVVLKTIQTGNKIGRLVAVTSGLKPDDLVLFEGIQLVTQGDSIPFTQKPLFQIIQD